MSFDYWCQTVSEQEENFEKLLKFKAQHAAQNNIDELHNQFCDSNFSLIYHYLVGRNKQDADEFRTYWLKYKRTMLPDVNYDSEKRISAFKPALIPVIDSELISILPQYSFGIQFELTLAKPYISKDEQEFYIIENPVKKDWVFKSPMVSPSTWKGNLRWVMRKKKEMTNAPNTRDDIQIVRLFGYQKEEEGKEKRGRLQFFPTFFDGIDVEIINPHSRKTKAGAGSGPIPIEIVPQNSKGTFTLLYVPFDLIDRDEAYIRKEVKEDLEMIIKAIKDLMFTYGFSAKKSSGTGLIKDSFFKESCKVFFNGVTVPDEHEQQVTKSTKIKDLADLKQILPQDVTFEYIERKVQEIIKELENQDE